MGLRVGHFSVLVDIQLSHTLGRLGGLVSAEFWALANNLEHLLLGDVPRLVRVHLQKLLSDLLLGFTTAPDSSPELTKLAHIDLLVSVLVRLVDESIGLTSSHVPPNLVDKSLQLFAVDLAIPVRVPNSLKASSSSCWL